MQALWYLRRTCCWASWCELCEMVLALQMDEHKEEDGTGARVLRKLEKVAQVQRA